MGQIVTFYSYKGGTGRSMALANVAWVLASRGARVLVVDWDLEAPGLHRYFRPFLPDRELTRLESQGVIDMVVDYTERLLAQFGSGSPPGSDWHRQHADIARWTQRLLWPSGQDARTSLGGSIDFVPAGRQGPQYAQKVNSFNWTNFYERHNGGAFMDAVRASMSGYDWVLIDSRTGVSDTSGICTVQFPDVLVVCFTLNFQSIDGAAAVAASAKAARPDRGLRILPLPTRLDGSDSTALHAMKRYARRLFDPLIEPHLPKDQYWYDMSVPYFSRYAYSEKLAPFEELVSASESMLPAVEALTSYITERQIAKLEPLPADERRAALAEFERLPVEPPQAPAEPSAPRRRSLDLVVRQTAYRAQTASFATKLLVATAMFIAAWAVDRYWLRPPTATDVVAKLVAAAREDLANNRRERAALLIAEAAARLGEDAVVSAQPGPAQELLATFHAMQPFRFGSAGGEPGHATIAFNADGDRVASAVAAGPARLFRLPPVGPGGGIPIGYSVVAFSPDGRYVATAGRNGSADVYETADARRVWHWDNSEPDAEWVNAIAFSPVGNLMAAGTDTGEIRVARVDAWTPFASYRLPGVVRTIAFNLGATYIAAGGDGTFAHAWSLADAPRQARQLASNASYDRLFRTPKPGVRRVVFAATPEAAAAAGGKQALRLVTAGADGVRLWIRDGEGPVWTHEAGTTLPVLSPDGTTLAVAGGGGVTLYDLRATPPAAIRHIDASNASALAFAAGGRVLLIAAGSDVGVWNVENGSEVQKLTFPARVDAVAASAKEPYVGVMSAAGTYIAFMKPPDRDLTLSGRQVQLFACSQTTESSLSLEEWTRYFGAQPIRYTCGESGSRGGKF